MYGSDLELRRTWEAHSVARTPAQDGRPANGVNLEAAERVWSPMERRAGRASSEQTFGGGADSGPGFGLERLVAGDPEAWTSFVRQHAAILHAAAQKVLGSGGRPDAGEVEDVVQSVFLKLWEDDRRRLRSFSGRSRLSTWLVAVAQREGLDRLRARRRVAPRSNALPSETFGPEARNGHVPSADDVAQVAALREAGAAATKAMEALPSRDRLLVRLVHVDGYAYAEVARLLRIPENSISPWLGRARQKLVSLLPGERTDSPPLSL